jgi:alpha-1,6-mannosyltransferase
MIYQFSKSLASSIRCPVLVLFAYHSYVDLKYPGVVPRTFTGPLILATLCNGLRLLLLPIIDIALYPMVMQFAVRFFLLSILAMAWIQLAQAIDRKVKGTGSWLLLITACQFHMPFYASRMLPNVFSLAVVLYSFAAWMRGNIPKAATLLVFGTAVFRCDLLLLLGSVGLTWLITKRLSILQALKIGVTTGIVSLVATVPLDSLLWQRLLWPEGEVFYYNTVLGKSTNWGTSPWYWYFLSALPKSMLFTILLVPFSSLRIVEYLISLERRVRHSPMSPIMPLNQLLDVQWLEYILPTLGFVVMYSFLGHKEMRFIFPAIPVLNVTAAAGMARLTKLAFPSKNKEASWIATLSFTCGLLCILATFVGSLIFVAVSCWNYPGGDALLQLSNHIKDLSLPPTTTNLNVYIDVAAAMSGVSLFGQRAANLTIPGVEWAFHKSGYEEEHSLEITGLDKFTHLLSETADISPAFRVIETIQGNPAFNLRRVAIDKSDAIYILERIDWSERN